MPSFDSTKLALGKVLDQIIEGKIQLPDFQRGWVWDDSHIRSLLVSVARSFPIGAIMLLETGGEANFFANPVEGVSVPPGAKGPEQLILDGQQRLTSLTQVLKLEGAVKTRDDQRRDVERFYYIDIEKALQGNGSIEEALFGVDGTKLLKGNFGRDIVLDLRDPKKEYDSFCFPCNQILNSDRWEEGLVDHDNSRLQRYMSFRKAVLSKFREYELPIIELKKENSKAAVCLVFEKVNTGGVPLNVFELMTATYAAEGFNLRNAWYGNVKKGISGRSKELKEHPLLRETEPTDFLQGVCLLNTYHEKQQDIAAGKTGKETTAVSANREHILNMPLAAYSAWADKLSQGFLEADRFLRQEGFYKQEFLPYRTQLIPLAAVMVHLGERWLEPVIKDKLRRWFWCGILGELYGGAVETRIALDLQDLLTWIASSTAPEPKTVTDAGFQASRLDTLRTRTSAAYRGLYVLLQREGSQDFFWKTRMVDLDRDACKIDIHHIFPKAWCKAQGIQPGIYNSIVNKTAISKNANLMIGGRAPSQYLKDIQTHPHVGIEVVEQDSILKTHLLDPALLRSDNFQAFYSDRKATLLALVERAMGKSAIGQGAEAVPEDDIEEEDSEEQSA